MVAVVVATEVAVWGVAVAAVAGAAEAAAAAPVPTSSVSGRPLDPSPAGKQLCSAQGRRPFGRRERPRARRASLRPRRPALHGTAPDRGPKSPQRSAAAALAARRVCDC